MRVADKNFAYWHSATFNNDGTKVIFTDEWGGGTRPRCRATDLLNWGADAIFDIVDKKLVFGGYYKMPAAQTETENCVAHNGSLIPVPGRDIMVQGWYQGGVSVFDFTDSKNPVEIAFFDRGPLDAEEPDHRRLLVGLLVQRQHLRRRDRARHRHLQAGADAVPVAERDRRRHPGARRPSSTRRTSRRSPGRRPPSSPRRISISWPHQGASRAERAKAVRDGLAKVDELRTGKERDAAAALDALTAVAAQVEADAKTEDAAATRCGSTALAETLKGRAARLR